MLGVVNLDKPVGPTSHDMVGLVRRLTGMRRIGHAGTLDPLASGVLPILVGAATRFSQELTGGPKRYEAVIRLGERSATDDAQGPIEATGIAPPSDSAIASALAGFVGTFDQVPPTFSARKQGGRTAHRAARAGAPLELPSRTVTVHAIDVLGVARHDTIADVGIDLRCGPGTYVRSLARDLGMELGCGGHLHALRRTEAAGLQADNAVDPDHLETAAREGRLHDHILPLAPLLGLPVLDLTDEAAWRFTHGNEQQVAGSVPVGRVAVMAGDRLLGVGHLDGSVLRPDRVIVDGAVE
jgi:tRNA pseudouridine55 synthase